LLRLRGLADSPPKTQPGVFPTQVTLGHDAERQLTREKHLQTGATQRLPEHGSALSQLREACALAKRKEKTIDLGALFLGSATKQVRDLKKKRTALLNATHLSK